MQISLSSLCHLCGESRDPLTSIYSDEGRKINLEKLLERYINPLVILPKNDKLCLCDTCKARLISWDSFILSCQKAQDKLKAECDKLEPVQACTKGILHHGYESSVSSSIRPSIYKKRSSNYCAARWCNKGNYQGVSLFRFPRERNRAIKWLTAAERTDLNQMTSFQNYYLCANHFAPHMFTNKACNQLVKQALPTLFPRPSYAKKIAIKAASSQSLPTQLYGVKLKSILPKSSSGNGFSSLQPNNEVARRKQKLPKEKNEPQMLSNLLSILPQAVQEKPSSDEHNSNFVIGVIPYQKNEDLSQNVIHILNPVPDQSNIALLKPYHGTILSTFSSTMPSEKGSDEFYNLEKKDTSFGLGCDISMSGEINSDPPWNPCHLPKNTNEFAEARLNSVQGLRKDGNCKKGIPVDLQSCFAVNTFDGNNLPSGTDICEDVVQPDNAGGLKGRTEVSHQSDLPQILGSQPPSKNQSIVYQSIAGSQDLLLAHVCEKINVSAVSFNEHSFTVGVDVSTDISEVQEQPISLCVPSESNTGHPSDVSSTQIGLFSLQTEEATESSPFINNIENLDELMDLDNFFEGR